MWFTLKFDAKNFEIINNFSIPNISHPELKKMRSTGSTLPEHSRLSPVTQKARNYPKDVKIAFQAICFVKIA